MPRQDGRIEPGQKLSKAISARAWNRAQEAADIVMGSRQGFTANSYSFGTMGIVVPCLVSTTVSPVILGAVVELSNASAYRTPASNPSGAPGVQSISASVVVPQSFSNYLGGNHSLGVIIGGAEMPSPGVDKFVQVCVSGLCVAIVRMRGVGDFIRKPLLRDEDDSAASLTGIAEQSSCGQHKLISVLGLPGSNFSYCLVNL
jgi:hypothetical protein